jgi:hypothetical protein
MHPGLAFLKFVFEFALPGQQVDDDQQGHKEQQPVENALVFMFYE